jgi:hypothetical protein
VIDLIQVLFPPNLSAVHVARAGIELRLARHLALNCFEVRARLWRTPSEVFVQSLDKNALLRPPGALRHTFQLAVKLGLQANAGTNSLVRQRLV